MSQPFIFDAPEMMPMMNLNDGRAAASDQTSPSIKAPWSPAEWSPNLFPKPGADTVVGGSDHGNDPPAVDFDHIPDGILRQAYDNGKVDNPYFLYNYTLFPSTLAEAHPASIAPDPWTQYIHSSFLAEPSQPLFTQSSSSLDDAHTTSSFTPDLDLEASLPSPPLCIPARQLVEPVPLTLSQRATMHIPEIIKDRGGCGPHVAKVLDDQKAPAGGYLYSCPHECCRTLKTMKFSALIQHYYVHTGERPHTCKTCNSSFTKVYNLNRHGQTCKAKKARHHPYTRRSPPLQPLPES